MKEKLCFKNQRDKSEKEFIENFVDGRVTGAWNLSISLSLFTQIFGWVSLLYILVRLRSHGESKVTSDRDS